MRLELMETFMSLGMVSSLDEEEEQLNALLEKYSQSMSQQFDVLQQNEQIIQQLINTLRTPPESMQDMLMNPEEEADDIVFF